MPKTESLTLRQLAARAGVSPRAIRFYLGTGLLPRPPKRGRELAFDETHEIRLRAIRFLSRQGLRLSAIRRRLAAATRPELSRMVREGRGVEPLREVVVREASSPDYTGFRVAEQGHLFPSWTEPSQPGEEMWRRISVTPQIEIHYHDTEHAPLLDAVRDIVDFARRRLALRTGGEARP
jgi:DNA-binding transcriptional MerR regulator